MDVHGPAPRAGTTSVADEIRRTQQQPANKEADMAKTDLVDQETEAATKTDPVEQETETRPKLIPLNKRPRRRP